MQKPSPANRLLIFISLICAMMILIHISISTDDNSQVNMMEVRFSRTKLPTLPHNMVVSLGWRKELSKKIFFLKTHKTGSSTVYNILARLTLNNGLTPLLLQTNGKGIIHVWPVRFNSNYYYIPKNTGDISGIFDIYMEHVRFDRSNCERVFPRKSTFYFTIMRDPVTGWRSTFEYFRLGSLFGVSTSPTPIKTFFDKKFDKRLLKWTNKMPLMQLLVNGILFDLGYNKEDMHRSNLDNIIKQVENDFDLVMIMEYFDESLIILKDRLNLTYTDILTFNMNESYGTKKETLTDKIKDKINELNYADRYVYDYFRKKFKKTLLINPKIVEEANKLKAYRKNMFDTCIAKRTAKFAYGTVYYYGYELKSGLETRIEDLCQKLIYSELEIKALLADAARVKFLIPTN